MPAGECDSKPDEGQQGVRQPVDPRKVATAPVLGMTQIEPHIKKLVNAKTRNEVDLEPFGLQILRPDVGSSRTSVTSFMRRPVYSAGI